MNKKINIERKLLLFKNFFILKLVFFMDIDNYSLITFLLLYILKK